MFQFDLTTGMVAIEVGPGDVFDVKPVISNNATEEMYVFVRIQMPTIDDGLLYLFDADNEWTLVESGNGTEDVSTNPIDAWNECKEIGSIQ